MRYFRVRNLDKYQHYKDRNPPWVKLYRGFRNDADLCRLQDASRLLATCIILLAAEHGNRLPWDEKWLQNECHLKNEPILTDLQDIGFIEVINDASDVLADCKQDATPREQRTENREVLRTSTKALVESGGKRPLSLVLADEHVKTVRRERRGEYQRAVAGFVFAYWATRLGHTQALMDDKRQRRILARLEEAGGDPRDLLYAVDGALRDDWIMGRAPRSDKKYDGIETVFRDRGQVERLAGNVPGWSTGVPHAMAQEVPPYSEAIPPHSEEAV